MIALTTIAAVVFAGLAVAGGALHLVAVARLRRHLVNGSDGSATESAPPGLREPVTHWRAVKRGVPQLAEKIEALVRAAREGDQILIGVDAGSPELALCEEASARVPGRLVQVIACEHGRAANPKISKYLQMAPHARHARWMLTDSEAEVDAVFVESFLAEWEMEKWSASTAGYRFSGWQSAPQILDTAPVLLTLWPGLMHAPRIDFTLGACTGVRAAQIEELGGWAALAGELAEDRQLGLRLAKLGYAVGLSRHVMTLAADQMGWWDWLRHQHRVAVTYRKAAPGGAAGMPIMHALPLAALAGAIGGGWWWSLLPVIWALRCWAAWHVAELVRFRLPGLAVAVAVVPFLETAFWAVAWLPLPVWWAGRWRWLR